MSEMGIYQQREWGDDMLLVVLLRRESDYESCLGLPARFGCGVGSLSNHRPDVILRARKQIGVTQRPYLRGEGMKKCVRGLLF